MILLNCSCGRKTNLLFSVLEEYCCLYSISVIVAYDNTIVCMSMCMDVL